MTNYKSKYKGEKGKLPTKSSKDRENQEQKNKWVSNEEDESLMLHGWKRRADWPRIQWQSASAHGWSMIYFVWSIHNDKLKMIKINHINEANQRDWVMLQLLSAKKRTSGINNVMINNKWTNQTPEV